MISKEGKRIFTSVLRREVRRFYIQLGEGAYNFHGPYDTEEQAKRKMKRLKIPGAKVVSVKERANG